MATDKNTLKKPDDTESGQIIPMMALLLIPLITVAAFAIDMGSFYLRANQLQTTSDLAALTAAEIIAQHPTDPTIISKAQDTAMDVIRSNGIDPSTVDINYDRNGRSVTINIKDEDLPLFFSQLFISDVDVSRGATATTSGCYDCRQPITFTGDGVPMPANAAGDGYEPVVTKYGGETRIYWMNHHITYDHTQPQLNCLVAETKRNCSGFPVRISSATGDDSKIVVVDDKVYYSHQRREGSRLQLGIGCIDARGGKCGITIYVNQHVSNWGPKIWDSGADVVGHTSPPVAVDHFVYVFDSKGNVYCLNTKKNKKCPGKMNANASAGRWARVRDDNYHAVTARDTSASSDIIHLTERHKIDSVASGNKVYASYHVGSSNNEMIVVCVMKGSTKRCDKSKHRFGSNGTWIISSKKQFLGYSLFRDYDNDGVCQLRATGPNSLNVQCLSPNSGTVQKATTLNSKLQKVVADIGAKPLFADLTDGEIVYNRWEVFVDGRRLYIPVRSNGKVYCVERGSRDCPKFSKTVKNEPYAIGKVPGATDCMVLANHRHFFDSFASDFSDCSIGGGRMTLTPCDCGGGLGRYWGHLSFDDAQLYLFSEFKITLTAPDGRIIVNNHDVLRDGNRIDLGHLNPVHVPSLTMEITKKLKPGVSPSTLDAFGGELVVSERAALVQ